MCKVYGARDVNKINKIKQKALVLDTVKNKHVDVLFLKEVHCDLSVEFYWEREWDGWVVLTLEDLGLSFYISKAQNEPNDPCPRGQFYLMNHPERMAFFAV